MDSDTHWLLLTPYEATLDDLDDPIRNQTSDRAPLVSGNISSQQARQNTSSANNAQGFLNSAIPGEDRRATMNTLDESVWETLRRDLLAVWEKMKQVLYPKYLLGGMMSHGAGIGGTERGEGDGPAGAAATLGQLRGVLGRWPDADTVLQGGMSEGLRDWDLWYGRAERGPRRRCLLTLLQGPVALLPPVVHPSQPERQGGSAFPRIQRRLRNDLDRRGYCHTTDQAARRQHV